MAFQYLFFSTVEGNEALLKEELRINYPDLNLSFSKKGFVTFKSTKGEIDLKQIEKMDITFCLRFGVQVSKAKSENLEDQILNLCKDHGLNPAQVDIHIYNIPSVELNYPENLSHFKNINHVLESNGYFINIVQVGSDDYWLGLSFNKKYSNKFIGGDPEIILPENSPSRAYLKMAQAKEILNLKFHPKDVFIEYGCAPGGTCLFLLNESFKVIGVDPANMAPICLEDRNFIHLKKPLQDLSQEDLPDLAINWVTVDLNLNPKQAIKEVLRLTKRDTRTLKGILFTIKLVQLHHIGYINQYKEIFKEYGASRVMTLQIPSHKQEFLLYADMSRY